MRRGLEDAHQTTAREVRSSNPAVSTYFYFFFFAGHGQILIEKYVWKAEIEWRTQTKLEEGKEKREMTWF